MGKYIRFSCFLSLFFIFACSTDKKTERVVVSQKDVSLASPFVLGAGDEINISVWRHDDLGKTVQIDPSGNISLPLAGEMRAADLTVSQLGEQVRLRLSKYIVDPQVNISVSDIQSQKIYVLGEVQSPGSFSLDGKMPVWEAIARAEGFTEDANQESVLLVRNENGFAKITALNLDILDMLKHGGIKPDSSLRNNDLIYVPPSAIADFERFMVRLYNILSPILSLERGIVMGNDIYRILTGKITRGTVVY